MLTPEQRPFFGQSVEVLLTIDEQGRVIPDNTRILTPTGSSYDRLVACLLKTWEFVPAANRVNGQPVPVTSNLVVTVTVRHL